jgi:hypothetical protein
VSEVLAGFLGVIVGAFVPWLQSMFESWRSRKRDAQYLAIRVVCILDKFVEDCAAVATDDGIENDSGITEARTKTPEVQYPQEVDWRSIDPTLMYSLLSFQNEVRAAEEGVAETWDWEEVPEFASYFRHRAEEYGWCGLKAASLSQELRKTYRIPATTYSEQWSPVGTINKVLDARSKKREKLVAAMSNLKPGVSATVPRGEVSPGEGAGR